MSRTDRRLRELLPTPGVQGDHRPRRSHRGRHTAQTGHRTAGPAPSEQPEGRAPRGRAPPGSPHTPAPVPHQDAEHRARPKRSASSWIPAPLQRQHHSAAGACPAGQSQAGSGEGTHQGSGKGREGRETPTLTRHMGTTGRTEIQTGGVGLVPRWDPRADGLTCSTLQGSQREDGSGSRHKCAHQRSQGTCGRQRKRAHDVLQDGGRNNNGVGQKRVTPVAGGKWRGAYTGGHTPASEQGAESGAVQGERERERRKDLSQSWDTGPVGMTANAGEWSSREPPLAYPGDPQKRRETDREKSRETGK